MTGVTQEEEVQRHRQRGDYIEEVETGYKVKDHQVHQEAGRVKGSISSQELSERAQLEDTGF